MHQTKLLFAVPAIAGVFLGTAADAAIVIDSFNVGPASLEQTHGGGEWSIHQSGLDPSHVIGGKRRLVLLSGNSTEHALMTLDEAESGLLSMTATVHGFSAPYGLFLRTDYLGLDVPTVDLTEDNTNDRFRFNVLQWPEELPGDPEYFDQAIYVEIYGFDTSGSEIVATGVTRYTNLDGLAPPTSLDLMFNEGWNLYGGAEPIPVDVDFSRVDRLSVIYQNRYVDQDGMPTTYSVALDSVVVVPEPSTVAAVIGGAALMLVRRRR